MSKTKSVFLATFAVAVSAFCMSAVASQGNGGGTTTNPTTPTTMPTGSPKGESVQFDCKFEGGASGKGSGWFKRCHATGEIPNRPVSMLNDDEGTLKVICDDGDDDQDDHDHPIYDDGSKSFFDRDDMTLIIKGLRHDRDDDRRPPVITVFNIDRDDIKCDNTRDDDRRFSSQLEFNDRQGNDFIIPGSCKFKCYVPTLN